MAPKKIAPTVDNAIPGSGDDTPEIPLPTTTNQAAGGYDPKYKPPTSDKFKDPNNPYIYTNQDWQLLFAMAKDRFSQTQAQLAQIFPDQFRNTNPGNRYDPTTIYYFKQALGLINNNPATRGKTIPEALSVLAQQPIMRNAATATGGAPKLPSYQVTNPADLKSVFRKTAESLLGRTLGDNELNKMVSAYQQQEVTYQKAAYAGGGKMVQQAPSAENFATRSIEKDFGTTVDTRRLNDVFGSVHDFLMGGKQ